MAGFFFTGEEAAALTPKAIERRRALLDALGKDAYSTAPVQHWTQGAARLVNALGNKLEENQLNRVEKKSIDEWNKGILEALGMGTGGASSPMPAAAPEAAGGSASPPVASPVSRETVPPPVPQQPLLPNRPQMPVSSPVIAALVKGDVAAGASADDAGPSPYGSLAQPNQPAPNNPPPLWTQGGMTKGLPAVGQMPVNPSLSFAAPGQMVPMGGAAPQMAASGDSQWQRMKMQESGNRQFDRSGNVVTSPKGATGIAQVMPSTGPEAARLAGLPWDPVRFRNDAKYNEALGKAYFDAQQRTFNDPVAAAAAYNAGPGRVNQAIAQQERTGQPYTDFLPRETQDYIAKVAGPDLPAASAQEAQNLQRPAPGQFNIPGQQGATPDRTMAIIRALSNPWAQQANPMLAGVAQKVLADQMTGSQFGFQPVGENLVRTNSRTGQAEIVPGLSPAKPTHGVIGEDQFGNKQYGWIDPVTRTVTPTGTSPQPPQGGPAPAGQGVPPAPPGVDPKVWRQKQTEKLVEGNSGDKKFGEKLATDQAEYIVKTGTDGDAAAQDLQTIAELRKLGDKITTGGGAVIKQRLGEFGIKLEGASDIEAYSALINRLTPQQRVPGSGATSDFDAKMFRDSLPRLINTPEGNKLVLDTMERLAQNRMARADIANKVQTGEITRQEGMKQLSQLQSDARKLSETVKTAAVKPAAPQAKPGQPVKVSSPEEARKLPKGTPIILPDGRQGVVP